MSPRNQERKQAKQQNTGVLNEVLEHRMLLYMFAAGATLAGASAAQAKVVYTPSNAVLTPGFNVGNQLQIDLNNDGTIDFILVDAFGSTYCGDRGSSLSVFGKAASNQVLGQTKSGFKRFVASALTRGMPIGSSGKFGGEEAMAFRWEFAQSSSAGGNFQNVTNRYLGVRFRINGLPYYGWIGFRSVDNFTAKLGGWAYETQPGKPILAGNTGEENSESDSAEFRSTGRTSLEVLAAGNVAIDVWRHRIAN